MVEDYGEDDIEYELAPVSAQLAYVQQVTIWRSFLTESPTIILLTRLHHHIFSYKDNLKTPCKPMLI